MSVVALRIDAAANQGFVAVNDNRAPQPGSIEFIVGEMRGELHGIREMLQDVKDDLAHAADSRGRLHEKVSLIDKRVETLESTVGVMGGVVAKQTARIDKIEPWVMKLAYVAGGLVFVGGALWFGIVNYGTAVVDFLLSLRQPPK